MRSDGMREQAAVNRFDESIAGEWRSGADTKGVNERRAGKTRSGGCEFIIVQGQQLGSFLVRNLREATPNSSQRSGLVKANGPAIPYNREKRWNRIQDLQNAQVRRRCLQLLF